VTGAPEPEARLTARQLLGWGLALAVVLALVVLFFAYGDRIVPLVG
jgi:hypothetical protein